MDRSHDDPPREPAMSSGGRPARTRARRGTAADMPVTPPAAPDARLLREAALAHLARFATTRQGLDTVLNRRLASWGRRAARAGLEDDAIAAVLAAARPAIPQIVSDMIALGAVDDRAFAEARARGLTRSGRSRRGVAAHLAQRGVEADVMTEALDEALGARADGTGRDAELAAALVLARKRRLGPWARADRATEDERMARMKLLAVFARAGFARDVAERALDMELEEAEDRIIALRST